MLDILDQKIQLHQTVEIYYVVDGWQATYFTTDGQREVASAKGETVLAALQNLERLIADFDIRHR